MVDSFRTPVSVTLFVHYQPHEIDLPSPSVTVCNRSITYQRNATDIETVRWYHDDGTPHRITDPPACRRNSSNGARNHGRHAEPLSDLSVALHASA